MGKRKAAKRGPVAKKKEVLATTFQCLFCNHENSVTVKLQKKEGVGQLSCKVCGQTFQTGINYLSAAVDVYSDWVDACEGVANQGPEDTGGASATQYRDADIIPRATATSKSQQRDEQDLDGFIENDEAEMEGGYDDD